ncbi:MAG: cobalt ECF transporter T component CbiQ [Phycisphaerales bacterium]|nr:MAG: cobalt ECF transporter T component CbiQ [Phycisphaerales bacterium]
MWALIDHHLDVDSPLHRWHPTAKLIGLGLLIVAGACVTDLRLAGGVLALSFATVLLTKLGFRVLLRRTRGLLLFIIFFTLLVAFTAGGGPSLAIGPVSVSQRGLELAALVGCKALGIALLAVALVTTTPFAQLCRSLRRIGCPTRLVSVLLLTYRMNFALGGEMESIQSGLRARGFRFAPTAWGIKTMGTVTGSLLVRSLERADRLYHAMLARGYDGSIPCLPSGRVKRTDVWKLSAAVLLGIALISVQVALR